MFTDFTNQYQLLKTLRFELKPVGSNGKWLLPHEATKSLAEILEKDRKIKEAYVALKPIMDGVHEDVINASLASDDANSIDFSQYFAEYQKGKDKKLEEFEKSLRESIGVLFAQTVQGYGITKYNTPICQDNFS